MSYLLVFAISATLTLLVGMSLLATARAWEQFDTSSAMTYVFVGGITLLLAGLAALWGSNVLRTPRPAASARG